MPLRLDAFVCFVELSLDLMPCFQAESGEQWIAQYDYEATDEDEVSFVENDVIVDVEAVDEGWVRVWFLLGSFSFAVF